MEADHARMLYAMPPSLKLIELHMAALVRSASHTCVPSDLLLKPPFARGTESCCLLHCPDSNSSAVHLQRQLVRIGVVFE